MHSALNTVRHAFLNLGLCACLTILASCGGSTLDDYSTSDETITVDAITYSPSAPTSGSPVSVVATVSHSDGLEASDISYVWTQTSGPSVSLTGTTSSTVYFTAPTVSANTEIVLKLTASADNDVSASKSITITVAP